MKITSYRPNKSVLLLLLGVVFYLPFLGHTHLFDWDEINFAESAREMLVSGNYLTVQIDFQPFWEKPPLFFWLQALSMKALGINEFAARLPNALIGILTLQVVYGMGRRVHSDAFGFYWALAYWGSLTPHLYFKSGIIDPAFNLLIISSLYYFTKTNKPLVGSLWAGVFLGLAMLTKGPVALLVCGLVWVFSEPWYRQPKQVFAKCAVVVLVALVVASLWFGLEYWQHGLWFFEQFVAYQIRLFSTPDAGHEQPFYYHFVVVLLGCFPASIFALSNLSNIRKVQNIFKTTHDFHKILWILFWVVLILFSVVRTKIVHYSSLAWFPVTFFAAYYLTNTEAFSMKKYEKTAILLIGLVLALVLMVLPLVGMYASAVSPHIQDAFVVGNLQAPVQWLGTEWLIGLAYGLSLIGLVYRSYPRSYFFGVTAFTLWAYSWAVVPKIEGYTQGTVVRFYESLRGQNVYVQPLGYKSYAHLFYFQKPLTTKVHDENWLLNGAIDKPVYFVTKNTEATPYRKHPNLELLEEEGGFVFFKRK